MEYNTQVIIDKLIDRNIAFACWFSPGQNTPELIAGNNSDVKLIYNFNELNGEAGFVFSPYRINEKLPLILLKPKVYVANFSEIDHSIFDDLTEFENEENEEKVYIQSKENYLLKINETINAIKNGQLSKVIISREIQLKKGEKSIGEIFIKLNNNTNNAFTYIVNLPKAGIWMGATPELLFNTNGDYCETVSLAGTQVRNADVDEYFWSTKDIEEQAFVSRYMLDVLFNFDIHKYKTIGPETLVSGQVAHLKTSFFFSEEKIKHCLGNFIAELHPTPAVCGLPKNEADEFILKNEIHSREYYTGFLGPWRIDNKVALFVNLRCMKIVDDSYILYVGGGITAKSNPEKEWDETNQKAKTLLSVIENIN